MQSSQGQTQTISTSNATPNIPSLPPELNPQIPQNPNAGGPSLDQIRSLVSPIAAASRQAALGDAGYNPPATLPNKAQPEVSAQAPAQTPAPEAQKFELDSFIPSEEDLTKEASTEEEPKAEEVPAEQEPQETDDADDLPVDPKKAANFKQLRSIVKETKQELLAAKQEADKLKRELEEYKTGITMPEVIKEKEARIAELEPLEHLHKFRTSSLVRQKFIEPIQQELLQL